MLFEAKLASGDLFSEDDNKMGWILVTYDNKTRYARPCMPFGHFEIPTKEWIEKYAVLENGEDNRIGVYVMHVNNEEYFVWVGFLFYRDKMPQEAKDNYSYRRVKFTENWIIYSDDTPDENVYRIQHSDGSYVTIDRTSGSEMIKLYDATSDKFIEITNNEIHLGGVSNDGLVKVSDLVSKLNDLENNYNSLLTACQSQVVTLAPSGAFPLAPFFSSLTPLIPTQQTELENTIVKH